MDWSLTCSDVVKMSTRVSSDKLSDKPFKEEDCRAEAGKHRDYYWIRTEVGDESMKVEPEEIVEKLGVPEHVVIGHIEEEMAEEEAVKSLPSALVLVLLYTLMNLGHDNQASIHSVEEAIRYDISRNARFAYSDGLGGRYMGFKTYQDVNTYYDFWSWMNLGLTKVFYIQDRRASETSGLDLGPLPQAERDHYLLYNRKIGPMRLMQQVLSDADCPNADMRTRFNLHCEDDSQMELALDITEFDVEQMNLVEGGKTAWLDNVTYAERLRQLEQERWLDEKTYRIQISFTTYNGNEDLLTMTNIHFFFARSGHIWKYITFRSFRFRAYESWANYLYEVLFYFHISVIFVIELKEVALTLRRYGRRHFCSQYFGFWNAVDWVSIIMGYAMLIVWLQRNHEMKILENKTLQLRDAVAACNQAQFDECSAQLHSGYYWDLEAAGDWTKVSNILGAFYPVAIMLRLFKAFQVQPRLAMVSMTLYNSSGDLAHFGIVFLSAFCSFAVMAVALFGHDSVEFANLPRALSSLFLSLVGAFDYDELADNFRTAALIFMILHKVTLLLIMLNMLVAIVMEEYSETRRVLMKSDTLWQEVAQIADRIWRSFQRRRIPFAQIVDTYRRSRGNRENLNSTLILSMDDFMDRVPGMTKDQAFRIMTAAVKDWRHERSSAVQLIEVFSGACIAGEEAKQVLEELPGHLGKRWHQQLPIQSTHRHHKRPPTAEQIAKASHLSLEDLFKAALLRLDLEFPVETHQVTNLRRILMSLQLLASVSGGPDAGHGSVVQSSWSGMAKNISDGVGTQSSGPPELNSEDLDGDSNPAVLVATRLPDLVGDPDEPEQGRGPPGATTSSWRRRLLKDGPP